MSRSEDRTTRDATPEEVTYAVTGRQVRPTQPGEVERYLSRSKRKKRGKHITQSERDRRIAQSTRDKKQGESRPWGRVIPFRR